jgi:glycine cleavage system regulatory protein
MCRLGGEFAGILRVEAPRENEQALVNALKALEANALTVVVKADSAAEPAAVQKLAALEVVGQDRPGIVRQISHALAAHGVNVEELLTECLSAPMTGETLFKARARVQIPESCSVSALRQELERIAGDLVVDINFEELPATH